MKKPLIFAFLALITWVACTSKAKMAKTGNTEPGETQLTAGKVKFPALTMEELKKGHTIFYTSCTKCHGAKDIPSRSEEEWSGALDQMAPKADLSPEEKDAVWKYIMAVKLSPNKGS
jgi:hypothetical protein